MRVGYARSAPREQTLTLQHAALAAAGCGWVFEDEDVAADSHKIGLDRALTALDSNDVLVVWRLDRMGLSPLELIDLVAALHASGCRLESRVEGIDTATTAGELLFYGAMALLERERIAAQFAAARSKRSAPLLRDRSLTRCGEADETRP